MVDRIPPMVSMEATPAEQKEMTTPSVPKYPWGLSISLCQDELEKIGLLDEDLCVGDMLHLHCLTKVTSVSSNETEEGEHSRIELQITHIAAESEDDENDESDKGNRLSKMYR